MYNVVITSCLVYPHTICINKVKEEACRSSMCGMIDPCSILVINTEYLTVETNAITQRIQVLEKPKALIVVP